MWFANQCLDFLFGTTCEEKELGTQVLVSLSCMSNRNLLARPPCSVSLCDLVLNGLLTEEDVQFGGVVDEQKRLRAEVEYASFMMRRQQDASSSSPSSHVVPTRLIRPSSAHHPVVRVQARPLRSRPIALYRPRTVSSSSSNAARPYESVLSPPPSPSVSDFAQSMGDKACCVCKMKEKTHAISPCFHMCVCDRCAAQVSFCPLCRGEKHSVHRIYT